MRKLLFLIVITIGIAAILKSSDLRTRLSQACCRMGEKCGCPSCCQDGETERLPTEEEAEIYQESASTE